MPTTTRSTTAATRDFARAVVGTERRATRVTPTRTLHLPTGDFLETEEETEDKSVLDRELASDKKFFELDAKSKPEASDSEGRGKKGYRDYFGIWGDDLDDNDTTRDLLAEEGVGSGSDREETQNDRVRAAGDLKEGFDCDGGDDHVGFFGKNIWPEESGKRALAVSARP